MKPLDKDETELIGAIKNSKGTSEFDDVANRIIWLIENALIHISDDKSGWCSLYRDPQDGRYWERSYPNSELHGAPPP